MRIERDGSGCAVLHVRAAKHRLVLLQGILELYENLAIVRTVDERKSLISIVTTEDLLADCLAVIESLKALVGDVLNEPLPTETPADEGTSVIEKGSDEEETDLC